MLKLNILLHIGFPRLLSAAQTGKLLQVLFNLDIILALLNMAERLIK